MTDATKVIDMTWGEEGKPAAAPRRFIAADAPELVALRGAAAALANASIDVSGSAAIIGYPECREAMTQATAALAAFDALVKG